MKTACVGMGNLLVWIFLATNVFAQPIPSGGRGGGTNNYDPPLYSVPDYRNLEGGNWLLADQDFDYAALEQQNAAMHLLARAMGLESDADTSASTYTFPTNGLWLEITGISNSVAWFNLHNATDMVYEVWSKTDLTTPDWNIEQEVWPGTNQDVMPFTVPELDRTNLFIWARDWTGVTENGNTTPDWWFWEYFGTVALSDTNLDSTGTHTLLYDYQNGIDPNVIQFSLQFTNYYVNTLNAPVQLNIFGGVPSYMAVLVNDTDQADAVWQPYTSSNIVATLGSADGTYTIFVGLRGLPPDATQTWRWASVTLYSDAPMLTITNPTTSIVSQSPIQLQGYASHPLESLSFDVSNATGVFTNQTGFLTGQYYDTHLLAYTTNYFECSDIVLNNGTNVITLHATDWAGNTANVSFTLDYSPNTNPPVLNLVWPQDGTTISGSHFTLQAQVSDPTATVTASINGNTVQGLVEQNGSVWVQNLSLNAGTNAVTLTASNAFGGVSVTNFNVIGNDVGLVINPLTGDQLNQSSVNVTGFIGDPIDDCVVVNGVRATVYDDGSWEADGVPVSPTGTASLYVQVYVGDPVLIASQTDNQPQPVTVVLAGYSGFINIHSYGYGPLDLPGLYVYTANWAYDSGGNETVTGYTPNDAGTAENYFNWPDSLPADGPGFANPPLGSVWDYFSVNIPDGNGGNFQRSSKAIMMIAPSGQEPAGTTNTYLVLTCASEYSNPVQDFGSGPGDVPLPPEWLQINGQTLINTGMTNDDGSVWGETIISAPAGAPVPLTTTATQLYGANAYTFTNQAYEVNLQLAVDTNRDGNITFDTADQTTVDKPYRFWVNNDHDGYDSSIDDYDDLDPSIRSDADNTSISCTRDLEDYARLWINTQGITTELQNGTFLLVLEWKDVTGAPGIRIFPAVETNGGKLYLTDEATAQQQTNAPYANCIIDSFAGQTELQGSFPFMIPTSFWSNVSTDQPVAHLLFDAVSRGSGQLVIVIYKNDHVTKLAESPQPLYLKLQDVKEMYERCTVGEDPSSTPAITASLVADPYSYDSTIPAENNYILFVHGWNLPTWEKDAFAETAFKRLYWQGYKGHFGEFRWPTGYGFTWEGIFTDPRNYDNSESNAWASATGLLNKLNDLNAAYPAHVYLMAHSMGNVVAGEALKQAGSSQVVNTYVAMQGAVPAHCYDPTTANRAAVNLPDIYANYYTSGAPCYFNGAAGAGSYINFYNVNDWALGWWGVDQNLKPDSDYTYYAGQFYRGTFSLTPIFFPTNTYEIFAYCDPAPSFALGAQADVGGAFQNGQIDLHVAFDFNDQHKDHSGEFNSDNANRAAFWNTMLQQMKLKK